MTQPANTPTGWWMHHGDPEHTGFVSDSPINSSNAAKLAVFKELELGGPVLSTPAVVDGFVYVGIANSHAAVGSNGGSFNKIELATGAIAATFNWDIAAEEGDTHGFCGMGCTPAVAGGKVYFVAFNARLYCLDQVTLEQLWVTDLRYADPAHNQPVTNTVGKDEGNPNPQYVPVAGWSSPLVVNNRVYTGIGEGESPYAYTFVYCLDADSGKVLWLFCTNQFTECKDNEPNRIPAAAVIGEPPPGFSLFVGTPVTLGCSVWGGIAYDRELDRLYCPTGNPSPDGPLPCPGYSNGLLALDASTGAFQGFVQFPPESSYRPSDVDVDVDVGGSPTLFTDEQGRRLVALGCKNGGFMTLDAKTLEIVALRQILPYRADGEQFPAIDPHPPFVQQNDLNPPETNEVSNAAQNTGENWTGTYSTAAVHTGLRRLFLGLGGKNYDLASPGIDTDTTPFLRAMDWGTLDDAWLMDGGNPPRYVNGRPPFYTNQAESGLALPAVVNDVVLMSTTYISLYAFSAVDGKLLWQDRLGEETGGFNGGYGYCMGPAVWKEYVVAGALVFGRDGGILRIYRLQE